MAERRWVWIREAMNFHDNEKKEWFTIPAWTKGYLVKPDEHQRESMTKYGQREGVRYYLVHLRGMNRYVSSAKLMQEAEWNERRNELRKTGVLPKDE
jgi:hypothetical protein